MKRLKHSLLLLLPALLLLGCSELTVGNQRLFDTRVILVHGNRLVADSTIINISQLQTGKSVFAQDISNAIAQIRKHPYVNGVRIARILPDGIKITITEREPLFLMLCDDRWLAFDRYCYTLPVITDQSFSELPVVALPKNDCRFKTGQKTGNKTVVDICRKLDTMKNQLPLLYAYTSALTLHADNQMEINLIKGGTKVVFNFDLYLQQLKKIDIFLGDPNNLKYLTSSRSINLKFKDKIIILPHQTDSKERADAA
jgi:cell division septal protein FtsQ